MSLRRPLIVLSVFMVLAIVVTWMVYGTLRRGLPGATTNYTAVFTDVSGLHTGDDVRVAGVRVGRVDRIDLVDNALAKVTFEVQRGQRLYSGTTASVTYQNIIGQRYLALSRGTSTDTTLLAAGSQIPLERTIPSFDISYLLNGFEPLFSTLDPQQVDNLTTALVSALQGDNGSVVELITQTSTLAESMAGPDEILGTVISNLNDVTTNLAKQSANLETVIEQARDTVATLNHRRDEMVASVGSINATVGRLATIIENDYPDIDELIKRQPGFTHQIAGDGRERASYLVANLPYLLKGLARITQDGSYANAYACDINISLFAFLSRVVPSVVRLASPGNIVQHSGMCR